MKNIKKYSLAACIALCTASFSVNATQEGQSHVSFKASPIENIKLEDFVKKPSSANEADLELNVSSTKEVEQVDKEIPKDTLLETYIREKKFTEAMALFDNKLAVESFITEVAEARGIALGLKDEIAQRMSTFDQKQVLLARVFDNLQIELQSTISALRAPDYDVSKAILKELRFSSSEGCSINKEWYKDYLSLVYQCGNQSNGYLINTDKDNYYVRSISSKQFGSLKTSMVEIAQHF